MEMFGSNNQVQASADNSQAGDPAVPHATVASFTMDGSTDSNNGTANLPEPAAPADNPPTAPHVDDNAPVDNQTPAPEPPASDQPAPDNASNDDLLAIKQQALTELSPLVQHLDQSPEDRFKTLMMMIQANDNQDLIKEAYAAAQQIPDEKTKSQALLDVVNEINYFTQDKNQE